jgi:ubiquinone/menaquinone biosynthesis C-methylase UbiE
MKSRDLSHHSTPGYLPKEYWAALAKNPDSLDASGLAPVLHPDSPPWFNRLIDALQFRAVRRAIAFANLAEGAQILDVGCGTGRWVRRYQELGFHATGVDATLGMLRVARECGTAAPLTAGEAYRLPFPDAKFDSVSDITVIQHIPRSLQPEALREMMRVIRTGGHLILMELIGGEGEHIFPREPDDWIEQAASCGAELVGWFGQEYLLFDRLFVRIAQTLIGRKKNPTSAVAISVRHSSQHSTMARRIYWRLRHVTAPISAWSEPLADRVCPARFATHGVFVFRK